MKNTFKYGIIAASIITSSFAFAQEASPAPSPKVPVRKPFVETRKAIITDTMKQNQAVRVETRVEAKNIRTSSSTNPDKRLELNSLHASSSAEIQANRGKRVEALKENRDQMMAAVKARRAQLEATIKARKGEIRKKLAQAAKVRVQEKIISIFDRLGGQLEKLTSIDTRITAKINEANTEGKDTSAIAPLLTSAQTALITAKTDVEAAKAAALNQANASTTADTIRSVIQGAETSVKTAAESYRKVLDALKLLLTSI